MNVARPAPYSPRSGTPSPGSAFSATFSHDKKPPSKANGFLDFEHRIRTTESVSPLPMRRIKAENTDAFDAGCPQPEPDALRRYVHVEVHPNGGASVVHLYQSEFDHLPATVKQQLARLFFEEVFSEVSMGVPRHVLGVVHEAGTYLPELISHFGESHPELVVKVGHLRKKEIETMKMEEYAARVERSYACGTYRCGPLQQFSLVGQVSEEAGGYFPHFLGERGGREGGGGGVGRGGRQPASLLQSPVG